MAWPISLTVCVSASSTDGALATTDELRLILGTTSTGQDTYQQSCIVRASQWADQYLHYPVLSQVYSEAIAGYGTNKLMLARTPVRSVLRVFDSTTTESATEYTSTAYSLESEFGFLRLSGNIFPWTAVTRYNAGPYIAPDNEEKSWYVEYEAGYVSGGTTSTAGGTTSTGATVPEDLKYGVLLKAASMFMQDENVSAQKVGDLSINYRTADAMTPAEMALAPYRRGW